MGISGSGKSTLGQSLAKEHGLPFLDADDFHPKENILKMSRGIPLDDEDRWPWLAAIVEYVQQSHRHEFVLACSALKKDYRAYMAQKIDCQYLLLHISEAVATKRLQNRKGHFMKSNLVKSQLQTLEVTDEVQTIQAELSEEEILTQMNRLLK
jgi:carbohydrate kinase (thermoresistant glucokinase family)